MKTLLEDFIAYRRNQQVEPLRVNIPRGNKIGMSKAKYEAALIISLCNFNLKELAEYLHGSYEVIRRWKADKDFKELSNEILKEFIWNIDVELEAIAADMLTQLKAGNYDADFKERFRIFNDVDLYSKPLIEHLESRLKKYLGMHGNLIFFDMVNAIASYLHKSPRLKELLIQVENGLREDIIDKAISALSNAETSEVEKREVIGALKRLKH